MRNVGRKKVMEMEDILMRKSFVGAPRKHWEYSSGSASSTEDCQSIPMVNAKKLGHRLNDFVTYGLWGSYLSRIIQCKYENFRVKPSLDFLHVLLQPLSTPLLITWPYWTSMCILFLATQLMCSQFSLFHHCNVRWDWYLTMHCCIASYMPSAIFFQKEKNTTNKQPGLALSRSLLFRCLHYPLTPKHEQEL